MRGCQRRVVFLKNVKSPIFEEAYFILKNDESTVKSSKNATRDMVSEANRIIEENFGRNRRMTLHRTLTIIFSFLSGALISFILTLIIL